MQAKRLILPVVALIFFVSGAFALVYEITWARMLSREFGSDAVAIAIVVAVFMLGLGLGARIAGQWGDGLRRPLATYGRIEILLSLYVMVSPWLIGSFSSVLMLTGDAALHSSWALNGLRTLLGMIALLPPTLLMGATLPILARFMADVARRVPAGILTLYALNVVGAVVGCLAAGFLLLPVMGMTQLLVLVAGANLLLGLTAILLSRFHEKDADRPPRPEPVAVSGEAPAGPNLVLAVGLSGGASMLCQIAWTRSVILVVGGSAYAFASVLAVFLAGLGAGALLVSLLARFVDRRARDLFMICAMLSALAIIGSTFVLPGMPGLFLEHFSAEQAGSRAGLMTFQLLIAGVLVFVPALFMGMLFPLGLRIALGDGDRPAMDTGRLYLSNTAGCVIGALLAGLVMIPLAGVLATLLIAVGLIAYCALLVQAEVRGQMAQAALGLVLALGYGAGWYVTPAWDAQLMASGISEYVRNYRGVDAAELPAEVAKHSELLYYKDGMTATVTVTRDRVSPNRDLYISTNGKIDGSSHFDMPTQKLSAHLPLLIHEAPEKVAVLGLGTGVTAGSATLHDMVERVDVMEIEPAMVEGARLFSDFNHDVHEGAKVRMLITDGRLHLMRSQQRYDVITSEPSNPWIAGIASLFTEEFYQIGANALREGGIFVQWLHVYDIALEDIQSVVATFQSVFPHTYVAMTLIGADLLFIGSEQPLSLDPERLEMRMRQTEIAADLADPLVRIDTVEDLLARVWLAPAETRSFANSAPLHRDDWPFLMYRAPLSRYVDARGRIMSAITGAAAGLAPEWAEEGVAPERLEALSRAYDRFVPRQLRWPDPD